MKTLQSHALAVVGGIVLTLLAVWGLHGCDKPVVQIAQDGTPTALIPRADLRAKDIAPFIKTPEAAHVLRSVAQDGVKVTAVGVTQGTVTLPPAQMGEQPKATVEAVAVAGTDKAGIPTLKLDLFTVDDRNVRTPVRDARTTVVVSQPNKPRWRLGLAVQAGVGLVSDGTKGKAAAIIGLPWLRKGTGTAEGSTWALLTPGIVTDGASVQPMIAPVSWNVAQGAHIPLLSDIWISPVVSFDVTQQQPRLGVAVTATF